MASPPRRLGLGHPSIHLVSPPAPNPVLALGPCPLVDPQGQALRRLRTAQRRRQSGSNFA